MKAKFETYCSICGSKICREYHITKYNGQWVHTCCLPNRPKKEEPKPQLKLF